MSQTPPVGAENKAQNTSNITLPPLSTRIGPTYTLPDIIGIAPVDADNTDHPIYSMSNVVNDTTPILEIVPSIQQTIIGLEMFTLRPEWTQYTDELFQFYGIQPSSKSKDEFLKLACLNVSQPSETFTNDFSQSTLASSILPNANEALSEAAFISNSFNLNKSQANFENLGRQTGGELGKLFSNIGNLAGKTSKTLEELKNKGGLTGAATRAATLAAKLASGAKIDFPQIWKTSTYSPSYSVSVRLYNPYPGDTDATNTLIMAPIAALLMFIVPRTEDGYTFRWPWLCQYKMRGLFNIEGGFIRSISVIKGGDDNNIAWNQRPGIVDLKIELGVLYQTMINCKKQGTSDIPTLTQYLTDMGDQRQYQDAPPNQPPKWTSLLVSEINAFTTSIKGSSPQTNNTALSATQQASEQRTPDPRINPAVQKAFNALSNALGPGG